MHEAPGRDFHSRRGRRSGRDYLRGFLARLDLHPGDQPRSEQGVTVRNPDDNLAGPGLGVNPVVHEDDLSVQDFAFDRQIDALDLGRDPGFLALTDQPGIADIELAGDQNLTVVNDQERRLTTRMRSPSRLKTSTTTPSWGARMSQSRT